MSAESRCRRLARRDFDRNSPKLPPELQPGEIILALETATQPDMPTRIRFAGGWVSVQSSTGAQLLEKIENTAGEGDEMTGLAELPAVTAADDMPEPATEPEPAMETEPATEPATEPPAEPEPRAPTAPPWPVLGDAPGLFALFGGESHRAQCANPGLCSICSLVPAAPAVEIVGRAEQAAAEEPEAEYFRCVGRAAVSTPF